MFYISCPTEDRWIKAMTLFREKTEAANSPISHDQNKIFSLNISRSGLLWKEWIAFPPGVKLRCCNLMSGYEMRKVTYNYMSWSLNVRCGMDLATIVVLKGLFKKRLSKCFFCVSMNRWYLYIAHVNDMLRRKLGAWINICRSGKRRRIQRENVLPVYVNFSRYFERVWIFY